jgi:hypothetical protein
MIPKSGHRFFDKIMLKQTRGRIFMKRNLIAVAAAAAMAAALALPAQSARAANIIDE